MTEPDDTLIPATDFSGVSSVVITDDAGRTIWEADATTDKSPGTLTLQWDDRGIVRLTQDPPPEPPTSPGAA